MKSFFNFRHTKQFLEILTK